MELYLKRYILSWNIFTLLFAERFLGIRTCEYNVSKIIINSNLWGDRKTEVEKDVLTYEERSDTRERYLNIHLQIQITLTDDLTSF